MQLWATKIIGHIKSMSYIERLKHLNLPKLKYRRLRGDMIETYKIINEKYDKMCCSTFQETMTLIPGEIV